MKIAKSKLYVWGIVALLVIAILAIGGCKASTITSTTSTTTSTTKSTTSTTSPAYTINLATSTTTSIGPYLVDGKGMTLYWTTRDAPGLSNITGATLANWPVFYTPNVIVPSTLNVSDFGTITRADGAMQSTYKQWPLYYYINDKAAGETLGQGLANVWFVVKPSASGPVASTTTGSTTTTTTNTTTSSTTSTTTTTTTPIGQNITINLSAQNMSFDTNTITVPAGASITVNFNNKDSGIPHNFAVYTNSSATTSIFVGQIITGPKTMAYQFTAPTTPGTYFFRCDIHPSLMTGTFIVTAVSSGGGGY